MCELKNGKYSICCWFATRPGRCRIGRWHEERNVAKVSPGSLLWAEDWIRSTRLSGPTCVSTWRSLFVMSANQDRTSLMVQPITHANHMRCTESVLHLVLAAILGSRPGYNCDTVPVEQHATLRQPVPTQRRGSGNVRHGVFSYPPLQILLNLRVCH